ncbi:MAG: trehalose-6-phosphate synthase [Candidatus Omnitrophica bacterium]|nr:trehalose-6-phosphate synthase [Candidatus Omnitrophota bacterium]
MKITFRLIISLIVGTAFVVFLFSAIQTRIEEKKLDEDLELRAEVLAKTFKEALEPFLEQTESPVRIKKFIEKFKGRTRLVGIEVYLKDTGFITLPEELAEKKVFEQELSETVEKGKALRRNGQWNAKSIALETMPLEKDGVIAGALGLIHDRTYIVRRINEFRKRTALTFSILALILSLTTLVLIRWSITGPIAKIADWARKARLGETRQIEPAFREKGEIQRLAFEIMHMASSLKAARIDLHEKSQVSDSQDSGWSKEKLKNYLQGKLEGLPLFVISNREPYIHRKRPEGQIECIIPASGVVTALDPVLQATGGMWIAHGSGSADRETVNPEGKILVPPGNPAYLLKRVWLTEEEEKGFYYGFSNEGLWPLCHIAHTRPIFNIQDWEQYQKVNRRFADALLEEAGANSPLILVQDYHFALVPKMIKEMRPDAKIALFWHVPWPNPEAFGICPWQEEILEGMLGSDVIGFHTQFHCNNFLDTVDRFLESRIDWTVFGVNRGGKISYIRPFPISIAFPQNEKATENQNLQEIKKKFRLEGKKIGVGVDRIDYTKGLLERFRSIERTLEKYPQYRGHLIFIELGAPSRILIPGYQHHLQEVEELVSKINARFGQGEYQPILFLKDHHSQSTIHDFYQLADFCLVSSLHDGMNLVAKEFVAAREDEDGVLILSRFTGASQELRSALQINPYDIERVADTVYQALTMLPEERQERMKRMRTLVKEYNVYRWAAEQITELIKAF